MSDSHLQNLRNRHLQNLRNKSTKTLFFLGALLICCGLSACNRVNTTPKNDKYDLVIYSATPAGIAAALAAAREKRSVLLINPNTHVGGMMTGGLSASDLFDLSIIGGIAREFFENVGKHYKESFPRTFEPHVAQKTFDELISKDQIEIVYNSEIAGLTKEQQSIRSIKTSQGYTVSGKVFIDASYEGDLMAAAGVSYTFGREGRAKYQEPLAGVLERSGFAQFEIPVPVHKKDGKLHKLVNQTPQGTAISKGSVGEGDKKIPAYNFRLCLTKIKTNKVPIAQPEQYSPDDFRALTFIYQEEARQEP